MVTTIPSGDAAGVTWNLQNFVIGHKSLPILYFLEDNVALRNSSVDFTGIAPDMLGEYLCSDLTTGTLFASRYSSPQNIRSISLPSTSRVLLSPFGSFPEGCKARIPLPSIVKTNVTSATSLIGDSVLSGSVVEAPVKVFGSLQIINTTFASNASVVVAGTASVSPGNALKIGL